MWLISTIIFGIVLKLHLVERGKTLSQPVFYTSNTMHTLNKLNTAKRKTVGNPSKTNIESVELKWSLVTQRNWTECYSLLELW